MLSVKKHYERRIWTSKRRKDILVPNKNPEKMQNLLTEVAKSQKRRQNGIDYGSLSAKRIQAQPQAMPPCIYRSCANLPAPTYLQEVPLLIN